MFVKQLRVGYMDVFAYIIGDPATKEAAVIDPGGDVEKIVEEARREGYSIKYILNTHNHSDHTAGNDKLKKLTGAKIVMHALDAKNRDVDTRLDGEAVFRVGEIELSVIHTPGHTRGGICFYAEGNLFTGDTLFVGDSGRTDLPGGDRRALGSSIRKLMELPEETIVWPGHDYGPTPHSTLKWERHYNVNAREYGYYSEG
jgi:hydroxyacylglutathione hydrolase